MSDRDIPSAWRSRPQTLGEALDHIEALTLELDEQVRRVFRLEEHLGVVDIEDLDDES